MNRQTHNSHTKYVVVVFDTRIQYIHCDTIDEVDIVTKTYEDKDYRIYSEIQLYKE